MRPGKWLTTFFGSFLAIAFCGHASAQQTIKVAYTDPLSGPFAQVGNDNDALVLLQLYIAVITLTGLLLAAAISEHIEAEGALRRQQICEFLMERGYVDVGEAATKLGANVATIRRDLEKLEAAGALRRVHK